MTARDDIISALGLVRSGTCGYTREIFRSPVVIAAEALPAALGGPRPAGTALTFLVAPDAPVVLHRLRVDQMYQHHAGDDLELLLLYPDGSGYPAGSGEVVLLGGGVTTGARPSCLIPGGTFHAARTRGVDGYALLGTTAWPGAIPGDAEMGDAAALAKACPAMAGEIARLAG
jgi:predicted cupin superfamily sugar epimerase